MGEDSLAGILVRLVLSLGAVLTLMVLLARYLRRRQNGGGLGMAAASGRRTVPPLQVLTRQGLSRGSSVAVVRVSGQLLLLGVTESTVSLLGELDEQDEPEPDLAAPVASAHPPTFSDISHAVLSVVENLRQRTVRHG